MKRVENALRKEKDSSTAYDSPDNEVINKLSRFQTQPNDIKTIVMNILLSN